MYIIYLLHTKEERVVKNLNFMKIILMFILIICICSVIYLVSNKNDTVVENNVYYTREEYEKPENLTFFETYLPAFATFAQPQDFMYAKFSLARIYGNKGMIQEKEALRKELFSMAETMERNELILHSIEQL